MTPVEVGLEILARLSEEQFEKLKEDKLATYKAQEGMESSADGGDTVKGGSRTAEDAKSAGYPKERIVKIKSGVFAGMQGVLVNTNEKKDEWRVRIELFENPTEAVFSMEEIEID